MKINPVSFNVNNKVKPSDFHLSKKTQKLINNIINPDYKSVQSISAKETKSVDLPSSFHISKKLRAMIDNIIDPNNKPV